MIVDTHIKFTTTFIFDPIMGIFKFSDPQWRVKEVEFSTNLFISVILIYSDSDRRETLKSLEGQYEKFQASHHFMLEELEQRLSGILQR